MAGGRGVSGNLETGQGAGLGVLKGVTGGSAEASRTRPQTHMVNTGSHPLPRTIQHRFTAGARAFMELVTWKHAQLTQM